MEQVLEESKIESKNESINTLRTRVRYIRTLKSA